MGRVTSPGKGSESQWTTNEKKARTGTILKESIEPLLERRMVISSSEWRGEGDWGNRKTARLGSETVYILKEGDRRTLSQRGSPVCRVRKGILVTRRVKPLTDRPESPNVESVHLVG